MLKLLNLPTDVVFKKPNLLSMYEGAMADEFVGQEFCISGNTELYYRSRSAKSSTAEVDCLRSINGWTILVEVISKPSGRLKNLHTFLNKYHKSPYGYVLSCAPHAKLPDQQLILVPLYFACSLASGHEPYDL